MAYIDPNKAAQINQTLNAMKSTLQNISAGLKTTPPSVVQQIAPSLSAALSSAGNVLRTAGPVVSGGGGSGSGGGGYSVPAPAPSPVSLPPATTQAVIQPSAQDQYTQGLQNLISQYSQILAKYQNPPTADTSKISQVYGQTTSDLRARYEKMLEDLRKKQQEDLQGLAGRYAAAGFSEPGILGGQAAGVPGVATKGMKELESAQASDIINLQQAEAGDLNALAAAQASAEQQAQQQAIENYYRQLQLMQSALGQQAGLIGALEPQTYQIGGRVYQKDPLTGKYTDITPPEVQAQLQREEQQKGMSTPFTDDEGNVWVYDANQQKLIKVGKVAPKRSSLQVITNKVTGEPEAIFDKTTGDLIPLKGDIGGSSPYSSSTQPTAPVAPQSGFLQNLWSKIRGLF